MPGATIPEILAQKLAAHEITREQFDRAMARVPDGRPVSVQQPGPVLLPRGSLDAFLMTPEGPPVPEKPAVPEWQVGTIPTNEQLSELFSKVLK